MWVGGLVFPLVDCSTEINSKKSKDGQHRHDGHPAAEDRLEGLFIFVGHGDRVAVDVCFLDDAAETVSYSAKDARFLRAIDFATLHTEKLLLITIRGALGISL